MLRESLTDAQITQGIQQDLAQWNPAWGDRESWARETLWSLTTVFDTRATPLRARNGVALPGTPSVCSGPSV